MRGRRKEVKETSKVKLMEGKGMEQERRERGREERKG